MQRRDYIVSTTYLRLLLHHPELIEALELASAGSFKEWLSQDYVTRDQIEPVFEAFSASGLESWVMKFGDSLDSTTHGPLGFTVLSAPNLKSSLKVFCDYSCVRTTAYESKLRETAKLLSITAVDTTESELVGRWMLEAGMKAAQRLIENLMGHPLRDNALIRFKHAPPKYADALSNYYQIPCEYLAEENSFSIPASWGNIPSPLADSGAYFTNLAKCKELKHQIVDQHDVLTVVRFRIEKFFNDCLTGSQRPRELPSLADLAESLALSPRTLARRLEANNSSYKKELEYARQKQAKHLLKSSHMRIADIAYYLGYQEQANFIRAFKQWFDTTPSQWRRSLSSNNTTLETPKFDSTDKNSSMKHSE